MGASLTISEGHNERPVAGRSFSSRRRT